MRLIRFLLAVLFLFVPPALGQEDEIVANLAGGRVLLYVTRDAVVFGAIDHPLEAKSVPPRVASVDNSHIGIFFGASEWQVPAQPKAIRLDRLVEPVQTSKATGYRPPGSGEADLEAIGVTYLEKLRPLVSQLHHKIDLKPDEPLVEIVLIGYAPEDYGPEIWVIDYGAEQESVSAKSDFWQTRILRPRFTQLYPPEKHQGKTLVELRFPADLPVVPLLGLIQQNDPRITRVVTSEPRFGKIVEQLQRGQANKATSQDASDFLRAMLPVLAGTSNFIEGKFSEAGGFEWIVTPEEPVEKANDQDKDRPPDAPTLRRKPNP